MTYSQVHNKKSLRNAERILNNSMVHKDFWVVDDCYSNKDDLQFVLDTLFDSYKNCYTAEIINNQNSSRLSITCNVCNVSLSSYDPFIAHDKGRSHKKSVQQSRLPSTSQLPNLLGPVVFKSLDELENKFEPGTLEDQLFSTSHIVLGWQFVYRETVDQVQCYTCQLCMKISKCYKMSQKKAFNHIISDEHVTQYMKVKFDISGSYSDIYDDIKEVQEMEGKIQCNIFTIKSNDQLVSQYRGLRDFKRQPSLDRSRSRSRIPEKLRHSTASPSPPPKETVVSVHKAVQKDLPPQTIDEFMEDVTRHYEVMAKSGDHTTEKLRNDLEGQDLIIQAVKVLSQKLYLYGLIHDADIRKDTESLMKKAEGLTLPLPDPPTKTDPQS